jgi:cell division protein ZapA (FtsZ GTPase activity inhibitor)
MSITAMIDKKVQDCKVSILGQEYCLVTNESEEHIARAAQVVDSMMREIAHGAARVDEKKSAVLTALRIASKLLKGEDNLRALEVAMCAIEEKQKNLVADIDQELKYHFVGIDKEIHGG